MKIGRNDPCPCGSGKKHKKCCLIKKGITSAVEVEYKRLSKTFNDLQKRIENFIESYLEPEDTEDALSEFFDWPSDDDRPFSDDDFMRRCQTLFSPWFLYNWDCTVEFDDPAIDPEEEITVAEAYMRLHPNKVSSIEKKLIQAFCNEPYTFWDIAGVVPGKSAELKDIFTGRSETVQEHLGTTHMKPGDIIFARVVHIGQVSMIIGMAGILIPPGAKPEIIRLRKEMLGKKRSLNVEDLFEWDLELRELYFHIDDMLHTKPKLVTSDGDPLELHKIVFDIKEPETALERLMPLCAVESPEYIKSIVNRDKKGNFNRVEFPWVRINKPNNPVGDNTILGNMTLEPERLTVSVNSAKRAKQIKKEISSRLGRLAVFRADVIQDMDQALKDSPADPKTQKKREKEQQELMKLPEVQAMLREKMLSHWENWVDISIPALDNKSPRKAVKTKDGREAVEALLLESERRDMGDDFMNQLTLEGVRKVRQILGLTN